MGLRIASRKSDLARLQAYQVGEALLKAHPDQKVHYHFRQSLGDINQEDPLWKMPEKGVFTEDFREGLIKGEWDMVVHSWKDLPVEVPKGSEIIATLPRADMRDLFLMKKSSCKKVAKRGEINIFTSSPRRIYNLESFFKTYLPWGVDEVHFQSVRGNIATRLGKLVDSESVDGLVVAKAAIDRLLLVEGEEFSEQKKQLSLWLEEMQWMALPLSVNPNAAAQGALAVEVSSEREDLKALLKSIHCQETWNNVCREREILKSYGGGCHQKIGVSCLSRSYGEITYLQGLTDQGEKLDSIHLEIPSEKKFDSHMCFPEKPSQGTWFQRKALDYKRPAIKGHFIARANALPEGEKFKEDNIIWVSGLKTWQKLAQRGYWVNGSSESLGESEDKKLEALCPSLQWGKWSHDQVQSSGQSELIATYQLVPGEEPAIEGKRNFYWMSGSSFRQAALNHPEILDATHYCGPGNTFVAIEEILRENQGRGSVKVALSFEHWKKLTWKEEDQ